MARRTARSARRTVVATAPVRCAIYTRKSSDEGLDKDFNSLDAQREACEAYVRSQRGEGWSLLPDRFDDGGFSGGNIDRPAFQRLLSAVEAGEVDLIVVYKLDRLSRSLLDFLKVHEFLEKNGVGLVSITQSIATNTPHGRMMVNVLLSFAQYEREIIAERTRDKMSAARRRGRWTGGVPVLGFDVAPEGGQLVVNEPEAEQVRAIFDLYLERQSLIDVANELNRRGWRRKAWTTREGKTRGGKAWDKTDVHQLVTDPLYAGLQKLRGETYPGQHAAIVTKKVFAEVQRVLAGNRTAGTGRSSSRALLRGLLRCAACGTPMIHNWTQKNGRRYRYYVCTRAQKNGAEACPTRSVPAEAIERFVVDRIRCVGADPALQAEVVAEARRQAAAERKTLAAEAKRVEPERRAAISEVQRLVGALANADGDAAAAVASALDAAQVRLSTLAARAEEVRRRLDAIRDEEIDAEDLAAALTAFDPVWDALLLPERERVLRMLLSGVTYDGRSEELTLEFYPGGVASLAGEFAPEEAV